MTDTSSVYRPVGAAIIGVALFTVMDALMKHAGGIVGAYNALLWRATISTIIAGSVFAAMRLPWPTPYVLFIHLRRSLVVAAMALAWFWAIIRLPLAEAIAISFIAPLIALYLAAVLLGEDIRKHAIWGSVLGLVGVTLIISGQLGVETHRDDAALGIAAVLISAVLFAYNLVLARQQALLAKPVEITFFQNLFSCAVFMIAAPWLAIIPPAAVLPYIGGASLFTMTSLLLLSWAYARAEAQVLIPVEYTAFIWAVLLGALMFGDQVTWMTLSGTCLIIAGCIWATRTAQAPAKPAAESYDSA
jgi:S-adenosylmethionine uptake transporter